VIKKKQFLKKYAAIVLKYAPILLVLTVFILIFFQVEDVFARPGGGHSSGGGGGGRSGGGSGGGGGGGNGGGELIFYFLRYALPAFPAAGGIMIFPAWGDNNANTINKTLLSVGTLALVLVSIVIYASLNLTPLYYACGVILCLIALFFRFSGEGTIQKLVSSGNYCTTTTK